MNSTKSEHNSIKEGRFEQTLIFMDEHDIDILIAASADSIQNRGNVRFLTNYSTAYGLSLVVMSKEKEPILLIPSGSFQAGWAEYMAWVEDIRAVPDFTSAIINLLKGEKDGGIKVGLVGFENLPGSIEANITTILGDIHFVNVSTPFQLFKAVKTDDEIDMARRSVSLADMGFGELTESIKIDSSENEIFARAGYCLTSNGAEDYFLLGSSGPHTVLPYPTGRALSDGDIIRFSIEPASQGGFWTQTIRAFSLGKPNKKAQNAFDLSLEALELASGMIKPGIMGGALAKCIIKVLERAEGGKIGPLGHGMGLDLTEPPFMRPQDETILKPGMVITIHPSLTWRGVDIWIGDTFLVIEGGAERLSTFKNELITL
jgi:Xaa-Pro dipeptidase